MKKYLIVAAVNLLTISLEAFSQKNLDSLDSERKKLSEDYLSFNTDKLNRNEIVTMGFEKSKLRVLGDVDAKDTSKKRPISFTKPTDSDTTIFKIKLDRLKQVQFAIYGEDDRREVTDNRPVYSVSAPKMAALTPLVLAIVHKSKLEKRVDKDGKSYWAIKDAPSLAESLKGVCGGDFCDGLRFRDQPSIVYATAMVMASNRVLTAEHVFDEKKFSDYVLVRNYTTNRSRIRLDDVIEFASRIEKMEEHEGLDFMVYETKTKVTTADVRPNFNKVRNLKSNDPLFMLGFPSGLPMKCAASGNAYHIDNVFFFCNLDAFGGNSGSPVFNQKGTIEGFLRAGGKDYSTITANSCCELTSYSLNLADASEKEVVVRIQFLFTKENYTYYFQN